MQLTLQTTGRTRRRPLISPIAIVITLSRIGMAINTFNGTRPVRSLMPSFTRVQQSGNAVPWKFADTAADLRPWPTLVPVPGPTPFLPLRPSCRNVGMPSAFRQRPRPRPSPLTFGITEKSPSMRRTADMRVVCRQWRPSKAPPA